VILKYADEGSQIDAGSVFSRNRAAVFILILGVWNRWCREGIADS
jgi:hypothetical protein